jgi:hypothetical protein
MDVPRSTRGSDGRCIQNFDQRTEAKTELGRLRWKWEDNIRTVLTEISLEGVGWMHVAEDRDQVGAVVKKVMNLFP